MPLLFCVLLAGVFAISEGFTEKGFAGAGDIVGLKGFDGAAATLGGDLGGDCNEALGICKDPKGLKRGASLSGFSGEARLFSGLVLTEGESEGLSRMLLNIFEV